MQFAEDVSQTFLKHIGDSIKRKRKAKRMSLEKLGLEIGLTRMQVHRIEKGYNITILTLLKIAIALEIAPLELLRTELSYRKEDLELLVDNNKASKIKKSNKKQ